MQKAAPIHSKDLSLIQLGLKKQNPSPFVEEDLVTEAVQEQDQSPVVFYHAQCTDGFTAAFCAWRYFEGRGTYIPVQFDEISSIEQLEALVPLDQKTIYILDFAFPLSVMDALVLKAKKVIWLDHHKTSFDLWCGEHYLTSMRTKYSEDFSYKNLEIVLDLDRSGAGLAWDYFFPAQSRPHLINYVEDFDLRLFQRDQTNFFILGLHAQGDWTFPKWQEVEEKGGYEGAALSLYLLDLIVQGKACDQFQKKLALESVDQAVSISLPGVELTPLAAMSSNLLANDVGALLLERGAPFAVCWQLTDLGRIKCSLRSDGEVDVEQIAALFGGGGHKTSAAFRVDPVQFLEWLSPQPVFN